MISTELLKNEEKAVLALRALYRSYGYLPYKMSKFEEYDLYAQNKSFLVSDRVITFTDTNGKLMALKPDVTLSIAKNSELIRGYKQKVYYNENVYRVSGDAGQYREIMQSGVECMGDTDGYDVYECVALAKRSLELISADNVLDISHLGIVTALLESLGVDKDTYEEILLCLQSRNTHDLRTICAGNVSEADTTLLCALTRSYGEMAEALCALRDMGIESRAPQAFRELTCLNDELKKTGLQSNVRLDMSLVSDMSYYNGIIFKGYINGISQSVLSGGQYDRLMQKLARRGRAVGFAVYLDMLEELERESKAYDCDVLLLYSDANGISEVAAKCDALVRTGKSVSVQRADSGKLRYKEVFDMREERA